MHDYESRVKARKWDETSISIREPKFKAAFCRSIGITPPTFDRWKEEGFEKKLRGESNRVDALIDQLADFTDEEILLFKRHVYDKAMKSDASAKHMELFSKLQGLLVERSETRMSKGR